MNSKTYPYDHFDRFLSCFSPHPIRFQGINYRTAEHAYHCQRYLAEEIRAEIERCATPEEAWEVSQRHKASQIEGWDQKKIVVMEEIFREKLRQCPDVLEALRNSGHAVIVKHQPLDSYWGDGPDGTGRNEMGKLWMRLREELLKES